jgi:uncharacterized protein
MARDNPTRPAGLPATAGPVLPTERLVVLDILRGFALFGILAVNMAYFSTPIYSILAGLEPWDSALDNAVTWLIRFVFESKFYMLFSFLFGLGLSIQMARAAARGTRFVPFYVRRLLILLVIGLAHALLIWIGDILTTYALLGFPLLLFRRRGPAALLIGAGILLAVPLLFSVLPAALLELSRLSPEARVEIDRSVADSATFYARQAEQAQRVYATGSFAAITAQRAQDLAFFYPIYLLFVSPTILAMFLLGLYAGKRGIFQESAAHRPLLRRVLVWGLSIGLAGNLIYATISDLSSRALPTLLSAVAAVAGGISAPALCLGYIAAITLLVQRAGWRPRLTLLAPVGRMALSNYLLQSLVCTTLFYGYGFGLFGQVGPAPGLLLTIVIYTLQIPLSHWWLRRFQFGPVEWLWRTLSYGRPQPFRVTRSPEAAGA